MLPNLTALGRQNIRPGGAGRFASTLRSLSGRTKSINLVKSDDAWPPKTPPEGAGRSASTLDSSQGEEKA